MEDSGARQLLEVPVDVILALHERKDVLSA